ncbi:hypothetical protein HN51_071641 [Arachis hypogaea]|uniref:Low-temperature-induced 65 kDa protein n=1 Tax=Arachis hypogaea TaxID=3818 RepID=A0A444YXN0_ARAHY|nr:low-temperature-induced 65 kDa protein isoform X1 [Arachis hypogaea]RYR06705.1 hypothetical protein Ahy_B05g074009 isoform A [Arachis hypogaea]
MDSRQVQSHDYDEHHNHPHGHDVGIGIHQVLHGSDEHQHDHEKKSVVKKVKAKAKKIKDKVTKHGHHDNEHDHDQYHYEGQHIPDDHDLDEEDDEDEEMIEDPEVHGAPIYDSTAFRSAVPGKTQYLASPNVNLGGTSVMGVEPHHHQPRVVVVSSTAEPDQSRVTDPSKTFAGVGEDEAMHHKVNLERPMGLEEDPHAPRSSPLSHAHANYQTKVTDPTGAGGGEIDITPVERSLERMNIQNEPRADQESKVLPTISETQYPSHLGGLGHYNHRFSPELSTATKTPFPTADKSHYQHLPHLSGEIKTQYPSAGSHDQFVPEFSHTHCPPIKSHDQNLTQESTVQYPSTESHNQFSAETIPRSSNIYEQNPLQEPASDTTKARFEEQTQPPYKAMEKPSSQSSYTDKISSATSAIADKAITAKNAVASKLGYGEKDDKTKCHEENISSDKPSNQSSYTEKISSATSAIADKAVSAKNTVASKLGYGDKGDSHEETQGENAAATSTTEYGKRIAQSLTDKLAPVYGKVAGVGSAVKSKVPGTSTGSENDRGVSVKDYFAEKLRPGDEDRALSEVISETLHHKRNKEEENVVHKRGEEEEEEHERRKKIPMGKVTESEEVKRRLGVGNEETERYEESYVNSPGKSVVDKVKDVVFGSWFTKPDENQPSEGGEQVPKNSGAVDVDQAVNQAADARRLHESCN